MIVIERTPFNREELITEPCDGIDLHADDGFTLVDDLRKEDMEDASGVVEVVDVPDEPGVPQNAGCWVTYPAWRQ